MADVGAAGRRNGDRIDGLLASPIIGYFDTRPGASQVCGPGESGRILTCVFLFFDSDLAVEANFQHGGSLHKPQRPSGALSRANRLGGIQAAMCVVCLLAWLAPWMPNPTKRSNVSCAISTNSRLPTHAIFRATEPPTGARGTRGLLPRTVCQLAMHFLASWK